MKSTAELINEIKAAPRLREFLEDNAEELTDPKLKDYLSALLLEKGMTRAEAIRCGDLSADYAYQIFSGRKSPSRDKLIRLAVGMQLSLEETSRLFRLAGVGELYPRSRRDAVIMFCIERCIPVMTIDELLDELGLYTLA
ncbi:MAG: helix-turn-helix domain-containing protein [Candidatus Ornithomonoglobus sp.]